MHMQNKKSYGDEENTQKISAYTDVKFNKKNVVVSMPCSVKNTHTHSCHFLIVLFFSIVCVTFQNFQCILFGII